MNTIEELLWGEDIVEDREDDVPDVVIDLDSEDWVGSIEEERIRPTPPRFERPAA